MAGWRNRSTQRVMIRRSSAARTKSVGAKERHSANTGLGSGACTGGPIIFILDLGGAGVTISGARDLRAVGRSPPRA